MNLRNYILSACIFALAFPAMGQRQEKSLDTLVQKFSQYREKAFQEKIFAHLDRTFYLTGETLWFKIYTVDASFHKPVDVSKVAYAEITDAANIPVLQEKIELVQGRGNGSFFVPASLQSGNYRFRIYTSWMKNFAPEFYFDQVITIVNPFIEHEHTKQIKQPACKVQFFPEGGNLVDGLESKVGFKVSDDSGKGSSCKGFLLNDRNDTIAWITPEKFGMGHFLMIPSAREKYKAVLVNEEGVNISAHFPDVHESGFVMQLRDSGDAVHVIVKSKGVAQHDVYLFVHARQVITRAERQRLQNNAAAFTLPKKEFRDGIAHLTVFTENLQPVCERLYFTYPRKELEIDIATNQKAFSPRKKVSLSLQTRNGSGMPAPAHLSMSVHKLDSLESVKGSNIYPYLWLGADLAGTIESPEYYFGRKEPGVSSAMDNLMLTHGWRRFDWQDILKGQTTFKFLPEVRGHIVTGSITKGQEKGGGVFAYLGSPGKIIRAYGSWSTPDGDVRFEIKDFFGPRRIIIQTRTDSADRYNIKVRDPFSPRMKSEKLPSWNVSKERKTQLLSRSIAMQVQDIFYYERFGSRTVLPRIDSSAFYGHADATYYLEDYMRFPVMEEVMREYVPEVFVRKRKDGFHFVVIDQVQGGVLSGDPMVLLDGVPILDVDDIMAVDPLRIRKLEIVKRTYYLGQAAFSGIVSYTTYDGDMGGMQLDPGSIALDYHGLQLRREFYSPEYSRHPENDRMPDQRYLLHWDPGIATDQEGKSQLEFFTSDVPGTYLVTVHGLDHQGYAGSKTYTFTVTTSDTP